MSDMRRHRFLNLPLLACSLWLLPWGMAGAQDGSASRKYLLLPPMTPPGMAAEWAARIGKGGPCFQPVRVEVPKGGRVTWYAGGAERGMVLNAPAQAGLLVGATYRLRLSDMPDYPGAELYPSIEVLDRLHPPAGRQAEFPVPVQFSDEEIQNALDGRLVTKVVYLEQPNRAVPGPALLGNSLPARPIPPRENPLEVADVQGRPMLIVRLGGRIPDPEHEHPSFFGSGAPVQLSSEPSSRVSGE